jgi:plasmid replication initiation protein
MPNLVVYKSNKVVEAAYKLSLNEQKIILACIAKNDSRKPLSVEDKFEITAKEFAELAGIEVNNAYGMLKDVADNLFNRYVVIDNPDAANLKIKRRKTRWISSIDYIADNGALSIRFAYDMLPYLSELKEKFTRYELKNVGGMTSTYGIRLYELLSQYRSLGRREVAIDWLRSHFEIGDNYNAIGDFKKRVIVPAVDNINKHSDLTLHPPIYKKTGRNVTHIIFDFKTKSSPVKKTKTPPESKPVTNLEHYAVMRARFGDNLPLDAIPVEIIEQLKACGKW